MIFFTKSLQNTIEIVTRPAANKHTFVWSDKRFRESLATFNATHRVPLIPYWVERESSEVATNVYLFNEPGGKEMPSGEDYLGFLFGGNR